MTTYSSVPIFGLFEAVDHVNYHQILEHDLHLDSQLTDVEGVTYNRLTSSRLYNYGWDFLPVRCDFKFRRDLLLRLFPLKWLLQRCSKAQHSDRDQ